MTTTFLILIGVLLAGMSIIVIGLIGAVFLGKADQEIACGFTAIASTVAGVIIAIIAGNTIASVLEKVAVIEAYKVVVIEVLDSHGLDNICKNFDCRSLTSPSVFEGLENLPSLEIEAKAGLE